MVTLKLASSLDTIPSRSNLDEDTLLLDAQALVELNKVDRLRLGRLLVKREGCVDLGRDTAWDDVEDLLAELNEKTVYGERALLLLVRGLLLLGVLDGNVNQACVLLLLDSGQDEGLQGGADESDPVRKERVQSIAGSSERLQKDTHRVGGGILGPKSWTKGGPKLSATS